MAAYGQSVAGDLGRGERIQMAADLKSGACVRITTNKADKGVATAVESGKLIPAMSQKAEWP